MGVASIGNRTRVLWAQKRAFFLRLTGCFLTVALATIFVGLAPEANLVWVANGVLLAYLLLAPRKRWPAYLCAGYAAQLSAGLFVGHHGMVSAMFLTLLNIAESLVSALLLRRGWARLPDFTNPRYVTRFLAYGVFTGPAIMGAIATLFSPLWRQTSPGTEFLQWIASDALGACVATPACVAIFRTRFRKSLYSLNHWAHLIPTVICAVVGFSQTRLPVPFLLYPLLVLVLLRLNLGWAALGSLLVAAIGSSLTVHGHGPFAVSASTTQLESAILLQLFIASAMVILYSVSVVIESLRNTERRLHEIAARHKLVTENSRDVIILADLKGNRSYCSSAVKIFGYTADEVTKMSSLDLVHPEDLGIAEEALTKLRSGCEGVTIECRIRKRCGEYAWIEASLRLVRDPETGVPTGILNVARDISERRRAEQVRELHDSVMRAIHEVTLDGILVVDSDENIASLNRRFAEIWRIAESNLPGGSYDAAIELSDRQLISRCLDRTKDPDAFLERVQELYSNPDLNESSLVGLKDDRILERYTSGLRSDSGKYLGRVWFFRDITERKNAERQLQDAYYAVEALAVTDALTGLANRRRFDQCLASEWRRGMRNRNPLSLLLIDVDLFKSYNDNYGHLNGDNCLRQIAEVAHNVVTRPGDLVARFGGEEFAIILPKTTKEGAIEVANAICESMSARKLLHAGNPVGIITVSIGCATVTPQLGQNAASLIEHADQALYTAKRGGRNQVCGGELQSSSLEKHVAVSIQSAIINKAR